MGLLDNLVGYWKLDDDLVDAHAAFDLSDSGSTGFATGKINNGASFAASTFVYHVDDPAFQPGDNSFALQAWVKLADKSVTRGVVAKSGAGGEEFNIEYSQAADRFVFWIYNTDYRVATANALGSPSTGVWYHIIGQYDASADQCEIYVNNGAGDTLGSVTPGPTGGTALFRIGAYDSTPTNPMNGVIDEVGLWVGRTLDATDRANLYNGGSGLAYPLNVGGGGSILLLVARDMNNIDDMGGTRG